MQIPSIRYEYMLKKEEIEKAILECSRSSSYYKGVDILNIFDWSKVPDEYKLKVSRIDSELYINSLNLKVLYIPVILPEDNMMYLRIPDDYDVHMNIRLVRTSDVCSIIGGLEIELNRFSLIKALEKTNIMSIDIISEAVNNFFMYIYIPNVVPMESNDDMKSSFHNIFNDDEFTNNLMNSLVNRINRIVLNKDEDDEDDEE